jgi:hypothetical protein
MCTNFQKNWITLKNFDIVPPKSSDKKAYSTKQNHPIHKNARPKKSSKMLFKLHKSTPATGNAMRLHVRQWCGLKINNENFFLSFGWLNIFFI